MLPFFIPPQWSYFETALLSIMDGHAKWEGRIEGHNENRDHVTLFNLLTKEGNLRNFQCAFKIWQASSGTTGRMCRLIFLCEITTRKVYTKKRIVTQKWDSRDRLGIGTKHFGMNLKQQKRRQFIYTIFKRKSWHVILTIKCDKRSITLSPSNQLDWIFLLCHLSKENLNFFPIDTWLKECK